MKAQGQTIIAIHMCEDLWIMVVSVYSDEDSYHEIKLLLCASSVDLLDFTLVQCQHQPPRSREAPARTALRAALATTIIKPTICWSTATVVMGHQFDS